MTGGGPVAMPMELRVVIVEDRAMDSELVLLRLEDEQIRPDYVVVDNPDDYRSALRKEPDLILSDWTLPRFSGAEALHLLHETGLDIPFIIVSGSVGEEQAVQAIQQGADDYVLKDALGRLGSAVRRAIRSKAQRDVQRRHQDELRRAATIFDNSTEGIFLTDTDGRFITVNPMFCEITGYQVAEVIGLDASILQSGRHSASFFREMWSTLIADRQWRGEVWNRRSNGEVYPEWLTISTVVNSDGEATHYVGTFTDMSAIKEAQETADFLARHDPLTKLPNRQVFLETLQMRLDRQTAGEDSEALGVIHLDLDRFKQINDSFGYPVGDAVLQEYARRIRAAVGPDAMVARMSGDEFAILPAFCPDAKHAAAVAGRLLALGTVPIPVPGHDLRPTVSIGIGIGPDDGVVADQLLRHAERAMYEAKSQGRNSYQFFAPGLNAGIRERLGLEHALRGASARGELSIAYQPQFRLADGGLAGVEALARWTHPTLGSVSPGVFIPLAEELGVVAEIGEWVITEACRQLAAWRDAGLVVPRLAVNLSVQQLEQPELAQQIHDILDSFGLDPRQLEIEVTESMMMRQPEVTLATLERLRRLGIGVAVDDFGTGFSSLAYLRRMPLSALKIDISFVRDIGRSATGEAIVQVIVALAQSLQIETIAEGIEEPEQADFLRALGCGIGQGYHFSRPLTAEALTVVLSAPALPAARTVSSMEAVRHPVIEV